MKRAGKDFSGRITPLFDTMMVQPVEKMSEDSDNLTDSTIIPIINQPSLSSQPKKDKLSKKGRVFKIIDADVDVSWLMNSRKTDDDYKSFDDSTTGEVVTTAGDDSVVLTTNEEITLAQTLIQIKASKPKVVTTADTTTTTTRPKDKGVIVQEPN
ncbi:hypothetical protein Tco_0399876 [Tanacetum coccineum]